LIGRIQEINSERILVISFTKASCQDISQRMKPLLVNVTTLHGFAYSFIKEKYNIVEDPLVFVEMFLWKYFQLKSLGTQLVSSLVENYFISQTFVSDISFLSKEDQELNLEFKSLIREIEIEKEKHHSLFFSDLINIINRDFDLFREEIDRKYDHLLVDEAQDLSYVQLQLLAKMIDQIFTKSKKSFFLVGDKKQSIYSFQGSSEKFYMAFLNQVQEICIKKDLPLICEEQNETYRFGGEILKKVNSVFSGHISSINHGFVEEKHLNEQEMHDFLFDYILSYKGKLEEIMVLYERNSKTIINLQERLHEFGMQCKIYLKNNKLIESLNDIYAFQQTGSEYYMAKIIQGPFVFCNEPEFYERAIKRQWYCEELFQFLSENKSPSQILHYLSKSVYLNKTDLLVFNELLKQSRNYLSLGEMLFSIGESIFIKKAGVRFSTIHSAKGLEAKIVFYIKQKSSVPRIYINLSPFFFSYGKKENISEEKNNLEYVALSRAKERLYIINYLG
jgi:superfamily I DNA/RNA helicase